MLIIYKITNKLNGKIYIGKTKQELKNRWQQHCYEARKDSTYRFHVAIREFGRDSFQVEVVFETEDPVELAAKEYELIVFYNSVDPTVGYNEKYATKFSPTLTAKLVASTTGIPKSEAHKKELSRIKSQPEQVAVSRKNLQKAIDGNTGKHQPKEQRENISNALKTASSFLTQKRGYGGMVYPNGQEPNEAEEARRKEVKTKALVVAREGLKKKIASGEVKTGASVTPMKGESNGMSRTSRLRRRVLAAGVPFPIPLRPLTN